MKHKNHIVGAFDKHNKKIIAVAEGWYKTEDGCIYDSDGFEWFASSHGSPKENNTPQTKIERDDRSGGVEVVRDFKIAVRIGSFLNPQAFINHYKPIIEQTMVETGWDYAPDAKGNEAITFGEGKDGFVHIYVRMVKKSWKNRANAYAGAKQGQSGAFKSEALIKAGALDHHIYGAVETGRVAADILAKRK